MIFTPPGSVNIEMRRDSGTEVASGHTSTFTDGMGTYGVSGIDGVQVLEASEICDGGRNISRKTQNNVMA